MGLGTDSELCSSPFDTTSSERGREDGDTSWGVFVPQTAHLGVQDWDTGKELQGYPEIFLFIPESAKSSTEQFFFPVF